MESLIKANGNLSEDDDTADVRLRKKSESDSARHLNMPFVKRLSIQSPKERVRLMLSHHDDNTDASELSLDDRMLFCQMDVLCHFNDGKIGWKEAARWLKYEEKVEAGERWSKPHVTTASLHSLLAIRKNIADHRSVTLLHFDVNYDDRPIKENQPVIEEENIRRCMKQIVERIVAAKGLTTTESEQIVEALMARHKHKHRGGKKITSTTDDGKNGDAEKGLSTETDDGKVTKPTRDSKGPPSREDTQYPHADYPKGITPEHLQNYKPNKKLMKKIPRGTEACSILIGHVGVLNEPIMALVRFNQAAVLADMNELALPSRFMFLFLGPPTSASLWEYEEIGRAFASLMTDKIFCSVAYFAASEQDLIDGIDEFIDDLTVLPPSIWDPSTRMEPPEHTISKDRLELRLNAKSRLAAGPEEEQPEEGAASEESLKRTGKICGGLIMDAKRRYRLYLSDIKDAFHLQCLASVIFLFFACITPIVTFGGLLGKGTDQWMGTMECLLAGAISGVIYHLFSGQPLTIVGATGPLLVFESKLFELCHDQDIDFLSFRFWVGAWITVMLIVFVILDLSVLVRYITRFTEECFAILISIIFIYEAFTLVGAIWFASPVHHGVIRETPFYLCFCEPLSEFNNTSSNMLLTTTMSTLDNWNTTDNTTARIPLTLANWTDILGEACVSVNDRLLVNEECASVENCTDNGWQLDGPACADHAITDSIPDVFFLSVLLFVGTFAVAMFFRNMRGSSYFPSIVRSTFADFAVFLSVLTWTVIDALLAIDTPKLLVPTEFKTSRDRSWLVNPVSLDPMWLMVVAIFPAALATILIFLDHQITCVIVNRKEHKLKKGPGYHLDLLVLAVTIFICSLLGLPWFVAATVRTVTHIRSLMKETETRVPGEKLKFIGVREQRVTGVFIHILIGVAVLITGLLRYIPMPVLYGVFLYMGLTSLSGVQFIDRIKIMLMPQKYQPDYIFLRHVDTKRVHIFTLIQILMMAAMWVVKSVKAIAIGFPVMILALCFARKAMDCVFTQRELYWLDHILPEIERRKKEDYGYKDDTPTKNVRTRRLSQDIINRGERLRSNCPPIIVEEEDLLLKKHVP